MDIDQARKLRRGDLVTCPADRGTPEHTGRVEGVGSAEGATWKGIPFLWVTVRPKGMHASVWPSNRLTKG